MRNLEEQVGFVLREEPTKAVRVTVRNRTCLGHCFSRALGVRASEVRVHFPWLCKDQEEEGEECFANRDSISQTRTTLPHCVVDLKMLGSGVIKGILT